jgi:hypothetical protein
VKRHLALGGKWLAGTSGVTALGYLVATEAAGGRHPIWPYWLFGIMLLVGLVLYFASQNNHKQHVVADDFDSSSRDGLQVNLAGGQATLFAVQNGSQCNSTKTEKDIQLGTDARDGQARIVDGHAPGGPA